MNPESKQLAHLTGFRTIAAFCILLVHSVDAAFLYRGVPVLRPYIVNLAYFGRSAFFVLSGFVICYNYSGRFHRETWALETYEFALARFARLYPLYAVFLLLSLQHIPSPLFIGTAGEFKTVEFISYLTLTQSWFNFQSITFNHASSISNVWFFYICFALCMVLPWRPQAAAQVKRSMVVIGMVLLAVLIVISRHQEFVTRLLAPLKADSNQDVWWWLKYYAPYIRVGEFIMGTYAAKLYMVTRDQAVNERSAKMASILSVMAIVAMLGLCGGNTFHWFSAGSGLAFLSVNFGYAPFVAYLLFASSRYDTFITRWCSKPWMVNFGKISYSVYLVQFWVNWMVWGYDPDSRLDPLTVMNCTIKLMLMMGMTIVMAYGTYKLIEIPCRRWLKERLSIRRRR